MRNLLRAALLLLIPGTAFAQSGTFPDYVNQLPPLAGPLLMSDKMPLIRGDQAYSLSGIGTLQADGSNATFPDIVTNLSKWTTQIHQNFQIGSCYGTGAARVLCASDQNTDIIADHWTIQTQDASELHYYTVGGSKTTGNIVGFDLTVAHVLYQLRYTVQAGDTLATITANLASCISAGTGTNCAVTSGFLAALLAVHDANGFGYMPRTGVSGAGGLTLAFDFPWASGNSVATFLSGGATETLTLNQAPFLDVGPYTAWARLDPGRTPVPLDQISQQFTQSQSTANSGIDTVYSSLLTRVLVQDATNPQGELIIGVADSVSAKAAYPKLFLGNGVTFADATGANCGYQGLGNVNACGTLWLQGAIPQLRIAPTGASDGQSIFDTGATGANSSILFRYRGLNRGQIGEFGSDTFGISDASSGPGVSGYALQYTLSTALTKLGNGGQLSLTFGGGAQLGSPTGGDKGANTLNLAGALYDNGTAPTGTVGYVRSTGPVLINPTIPDVALGGTSLLIGGLGQTPATNWLEKAIPTTAGVSQLTSLSTLGNGYGAIGAIRASNTAAAPSDSFGVGGFGINDGSLTTQTSWGLFGQAIVAGPGTGEGAETDIIVTGGANPHATPYVIPVPLSAGLLVGSGDPGYAAVSFTGSIANVSGQGILTVSAISAGTFHAWDVIQGAGVPASTWITGCLTGACTGQLSGFWTTGTYSLNKAATVGSEAMTYTPLDASMAFGFLNNTTKAKTGYFLGATSISYVSGVDGDAVIGDAVGLGRMHGINWYNSSNVNNVITAASWGAAAGGTLTFTTTTPHTIVVGEYFIIENMLPLGYNGAFQATSGTTGSTLKTTGVANPGTETVLGDLQAMPSNSIYSATQSVVTNPSNIRFDNLGIIFESNNGVTQGTPLAVFEPVAAADSYYTLVNGTALVTMTATSNSAASVSAKYAAKGAGGTHVFAVNNATIVTIASGGLSGTTLTATTSLFDTGIGSDAAHTDTTVCQDTTTHLFLAGSGAAGICLGTSSLRFKTDVHDLRPGLAEVVGLRAIDYRYKPGYGGEGVKYGWAAEEVEKVLPELVGHDKEGLPNSVDWAGAVPVLWHAMQQLDAKIEKLEGRVR